MKYVIDIETNGLLRDMVDTTIFPYRLKDTAKLWCVVITNVETRVSYTAIQEEITLEWIKSILVDCEELIAHNGIAFDFKVLQLFGLLDYKIGWVGEESTLFGKPCKFSDTLIYSRLLSPDRHNGHSLDSWGERTNNPKIDYRQTLINEGLLSKTAKKGEEFQFYTDYMSEYCKQDTLTNVDTYLVLIEEIIVSGVWFQSIAVENKLADLAVNRETLGFWFDKELAINNLNYLLNEMNTLSNNVNQYLPKRKRNKGEMTEYTPPKKQLKKDNTLTSLMEKFIDKIGATHVLLDDTHYILFNQKEYQLPYEEPLVEDIITTIDNLDAVKMHLIDLGWIPTLWKERDLTKDSKKQNLSYKKRVEALERWFNETINGKYKEQRVEATGLNVDRIIDEYKIKLLSDKPVKVYTSPCVRVGVDKELCPNLIKLGDKVAFAKDFTLYLTYKHRKNSIAGGEIEDIDFDVDYPNTGYLANYRNNDGRIPTPAIEIGAATHRYKHISVANIPRASSLFGKEMRSMFGSGNDALQLGFDFASLEARIQGHYIYPYSGGKELAEMLLAEKPNDIHSVTARQLSISRDDAKSINYAILYGAAPSKIKNMLNLTTNEAKELYDRYWETKPSLKQLKDKLTNFWLSTDKKYIPTIDKRRVNIRSEHSILNALFQSAGVICAKYVTVFLFEDLEKQGYIISPFIGKPDVCSMIEYHDENQLYVNPNLITILEFDTKDNAKEYLKQISNTPYQYSAISYNKRLNKYIVCPPNTISKAINDSLIRLKEYLGLRVDIGIEWIVGDNWYECH